MTDGDLTIRPYQPADRQAVLDLWYDVGLGNPPNRPEIDLDMILESGQGTLVVGELDGHLVATTVMADDGHRGWIYYVAVAVSLQGRGIGIRMVRYAEVWLAERGVAKVLLMIRDTNIAVRAFYERLGYAVEPVSTLGRWLHDVTPANRISDR